MSDSGKHSKGCRCKKSNCLKRYCECFQAGVLCGDNCKCQDCKNFSGSAEREDLLATLATINPGFAPSVKVDESEGSLSPRSGRRLFATPVSSIKVLQQVLSQPVISELCKVMLLSANDVDIAANERSHPNPVPKHSSSHPIFGLSRDSAPASNGVSSSQQPASTPGLLSSLACPESDATTSPKDDRGLADLSDVFAAQERAVLEDFNRFLQRAVHIVQKNASQAETPSGSQSQASAPSSMPPPSNYPASGYSASTPAASAPDVELPASSNGARRALGFSPAPGLMSPLKVLNFDEIYAQHAPPDSNGTPISGFAAPLIPPSSAASSSMPAPQAPAPRTHQHAAGLPSHPPSQSSAPDLSRDESNPNVP
eukprot:TRINITY_DN765_c0_g2_i1.p1 TRINITY_DN765_c0_g2~~TRINITY_DN765_c0_g2_i1.p1  ORF type:complete len:369 (-),score=101.92 TRINITY_DN765_c0_g2_i1:115-1221(-)